MTATTGTKASTILNFLGTLFGLLMTTDLTPFFATGSKAVGIITTAIFGANTLLHAFTGNSPIVKMPGG